MIPPRAKKPLKRVLKSLNLYPFLPRTLHKESTFWKSTLPNWDEILSRDPERWAAARLAVAGGPKVLIGCAWAGNSGNSLIDGLLAVALTLRGTNVHLLLCDETLPACALPGIRHYGENERFVTKGPSTLTCKKCFQPGKQMFRPLGLPTHYFSQFITSEEVSEAQRLSKEVPLAEIRDFHLNGLPLGEHAYSGALRFYMAGYLDTEPHGEAVLRHYLNASLLTAYATRRLLKTHSFDCVCMVHGIYVPHGIMLDVAREQKVGRVTWSRAYRTQTFVFSHDDTYHRTMLTEPVEDWAKMAWTPELEAEIMDYLKSRWKGTRDWISYQKNPQEDATSAFTELGVNCCRPIIGMLTNVMGDGQVLHPTSAFRTMLEWAVQTIEYFVKRPELQLVVRVHPAEVRGTDPSRQPLIQEISRVFPQLPPNIFIIPAESPISTYAAMLLCDSVIVYATQTSVELTSMGIPVIVAGDAWTRNKQISWDASTPQEYLQLLDRLPLRERLSDAIMQRARKYAYHHFFRRMIPLPFLETVHPTYKLKISGLEDLLPGRSLGLDVVCRGIMKGEKFTYPAEQHLESLDDHMRVAPENGNGT
jgi:hypothetical protein